MNLENITIQINNSNASDVRNHLNDANETFIPHLSDTLNIENYSLKIFNFAERIEAWSGNKLVGLVAIYLNDIKEHKGFITNVSVSPIYQKKGIANRLMRECLNHAIRNNFILIDLEVHVNNEKAIALYKKLGFIQIESSENTIKMRCKLS